MDVFIIITRSSLEEEAGGRAFRPLANKVYATLVDRENRGWFGTEDGVFYFDGVVVREVMIKMEVRCPPLMHSI